MWLETLGLTQAVAAAGLHLAGPAGLPQATVSIQDLTAVVAGAPPGADRGPVIGLPAGFGDISVQSGAGFGVQALSLNTGTGSVVQSAVFVTANVTFSGGLGAPVPR